MRDVINILGKIFLSILISTGVLLLGKLVQFILNEIDQVDENERLRSEGLRISCYVVIWIIGIIATGLVLLVLQSRG